MSTFSFSANHFTKEDEERELNELTEDERQEILDDMYGRSRATRRRNPGTNHTDANFSNYEAEILTYARQVRDSNTGNYGNDTNSDNEESEEENEDDEEGEEDEEEEDILMGGNEHDPDTRDDIPGRLLDLFQMAMSVIPTNESAEYWMAWTSAPELLDLESTAPRFLRCENYNPNDAATRMCTYWKLRYEIFGEEDALKPMTLGGAMKDVVPFMLQIPNAFRILPDDGHGRTVICVDRTPLKFKDYDYFVLLKIIWYTFHKALEKESAQRNGVVVIIINQAMHWDLPSISLVRLFLKSFNQCIPTKIRCIHGCFSSLVSTLVAPIVKQVLPRHARLRLQLHDTLNRPKMLNDLESYGLLRENLPKSIGGSYNKEPSWVESIRREQAHRSKKRPSHVLGDSDDDSNIAAANTDD